MASVARLHLPEGKLSGTLRVEPSKSLSNRALIIRSLSPDMFPIDSLSESDDTRTLAGLLESEHETLNAGHAGTTFRFLLARACLFDRPVILDGSEAFRLRPIGPLVEALRSLGANILYLDRPGFAPVRITPAAAFGEIGHVSVDSTVSSQFISALLMIGPALPNGLEIRLRGSAVSRSYIEMTRSMMQRYGVKTDWSDDRIRVPAGPYRPGHFAIEGDWSGASYFFSMAALAGEADLHLLGLSEDSWQGDAVVRSIYSSLGLVSEFSPDGVRIRKADGYTPKGRFSMDFRDCPDLAQTVMVTLAGLGIDGSLRGVETLQWKETHRLTAMREELARVGTTVGIFQAAGSVTVTIAGQAAWQEIPSFETHQDHRMAMALAALGCLGPVSIRHPEVVGKSFPGFWRACRAIGWQVDGSA